MAHFAVQVLVTALTIHFSGRASASVSAIHNLHKANPLCDTAGNSFVFTEELDFTSRRRILSSHACPNHFNKCQDEECSGQDVTRARVNAVTFSVPLYPVMAKVQTDTTCMNGTVALALNGVSIESMSCKERVCVAPGFNPESRQSIGDKSCDLMGEGDGTWICGDAVQLDATKIDKCGGHVDDRGLYHYHIPPVCLIQQLTEMRQVNITEQETTSVTNSDTAPDTITDVVLRSSVLHSVQIGWALDGFPVYGPVGPNGILMQPCSTLSVEQSPSVDFCLDECNGLYGSLEGVDDFLYRYYVSGEMGSGECSAAVENGGPCSRVSDKCCVDKVPSAVYQPYTIGCFKGCTWGDSSCAVSKTAAVSDTYYPQVSLHPEVTFTGIPSSTEAENSFNTTGNESTDVLGEDNVPGNSTADYTALVENLTYSGYGRTAVRLRGRKLGLLSKIREDTSSGSVNPSGVIEELVQSEEDAFITGLTLGYRGKDEASSQLLFTTQRGLWSIQEDGQLGQKFVSGYKTVLIKGYNLGSSLADIKLLTVKGHNCSYIEVIDSMNVLCTLSNMADEESVEDDDVILNTIAGNNVGIHRQPLTVALSATKRAVVSEISITTYSMLPYAVAYPFAVPVTTTSASEVFVYWSDLASHRIYRSTVSGSNIEVVMEDVHNVYSLLLVDKSSAPSQEPESSEDQFLFYTEANRGILGRLAVSSGSRLAGGAYVGHQHSVDNPGSENNNTNVILLKGLSDPRGISAQSHRGYFYFATYEGDAFEAPLSHFTDAQPPATPVDMSTPPTWLKRLVRAKTSSRFDGIATLPLSTLPTSSNTVKPWNEQYIFIPDTSSNSLVAVNDDSFALSTLNLNEGFGSSGIVWPRSIAARRPYENDESPPGNNSVVLFVGELLGKIWRVDLDFTSQSGRKISLSGLKRPQLLADYSKYSASFHLRSLVSGNKYSDDRNNQIFPEIIN